MSTSFCGDRSWLFAHVFYEPLPSRWRLCVWVFMLEILDLLRPKYPNIHKKNVWRKNKKFGIGLARVYRTRVSNVRVYLQTQRGRWMPRKFGPVSLSLNQPVAWQAWQTWQARNSTFWANHRNTVLSDWLTGRPRLKNSPISLEYSWCVFADFL